MIGGNFPVPGGFVIYCDDNLLEEEITSLYYKFIGNGNVAVRSSSMNEDGEVRSGAGSYKTLIDVSVENLYDAILSVRDDAINSKNGDKITIIVQKYIEAKISGVAFSIDPINFDNDVIVVEYHEGIGEELVSGEIIPNTVVINKRRSENENNLFLQNVKKFVIQLESFFGFPVDVEWCVDKLGNFWILQCRQVTSIPHNYYNLRWSINEPLWAMDLAFFIRFGAGCHSIIKNIYNREEIIYSRKNLEDFEYYEGVRDEINAMYYFRNAMDEKDFDHREIYNEIMEVFNKVESLGIKDRFEILARLYCKCVSAYLISETSITDIFEREVLLYFSNDELEYIIHRNSEDIMIKEQNDFLKVNANDEVELLNHVRKYPYLALSFFDKDDLVKHLRLSNKMLKGQNISKSENSQTISHNLKFIESIEDKLKSLPQKIVGYIEKLKFLSSDRMKIKNGWGGVHFFMIDIIDYLSKNFGESKSDIYDYYLYEDIVLLISDGIKLSQEEKDLRKKGVLMEIIEMNGKLMPSIKFGKYFEYKKSSEEKSEDFILKGNAVIKKKVSGVVKIIKDNNFKFSDSLEDTIIVTSMPQPNIIPIIRNSLGLITNEGGVLSHAAILSREYNLACIVGTKYATKVLNNGDVVTMWADGKITKDS